MKIIISKKQWEEIGEKAGWIEAAGSAFDYCGTDNELENIMEKRWNKIAVWGIQPGNIIGMTSGNGKAVSEYFRNLKHVSINGVKGLNPHILLAEIKNEWEMYNNGDTARWYFDVDSGKITWWFNPSLFIRIETFKYIKRICGVDVTSQAVIASRVSV